MGSLVQQKQHGQAPKDRNRGNKGLQKLQSHDVGFSESQLKELVVRFSEYNKPDSQNYKVLFRLM